LEFKPVTISDIAKLLNLSTSTVSRALKDHPDINADTKKRVRDAASKLNYHPNSIAAGLRQSQTKTIGVIVPKISNYFYSSAISGIEDLAYASGYRVIICQSDESYEREVMNTRALLSGMVDGLLVAISRETKDVTHFEEVKNRKTGLIFFNRVPDEMTASKVFSDDIKGAYLATEYLIRSGCQRIAHFSGPENLSLSRNRLQGYNEALNDYRINLGEQWVYGSGANSAFGHEAVMAMLESGKMADGITAFNDWVAIGAMLELKKHGYKIPEDVAVFGFSNIPSATIIEPTLSTVDQSGFTVGKKAFELLIDQINGDKISGHRAQAVIDTSLIIRNSTFQLDAYNSYRNS